MRIDSSTVVLTPRVMQLRRLVIGEVSRFPELAKVLYERGPQRAVSALAALFERLADRGLLAIDDPLVAASHFNWLVMSAPLNQAMLLGTRRFQSRRNFADMLRKACAYSWRHTASSSSLVGQDDDRTRRLLLRPHRLGDFDGYAALWAGAGTKRLILMRSDGPAPAHLALTQPRAAVGVEQIQPVRREIDGERVRRHWPENPWAP